MIEPIVFEEDTALAKAAFEHFSTHCRQALAERGEFVVALSGGSSPYGLFDLLAHSEADLPWEKIKVFFSDERYVPLDHPDSNFGSAKRRVLDRVPAHVFPVPVDAPSAAEAARWYENQIVAQLGNRPRFDWVLLGLGSDGHTASLFPGKEALDSNDWVTHSSPGVLPPPVERITFTFPLINAARSILMLATGKAKHTPLAQWIAEEGSLRELPVLGLAPVDGTLTILADRGARGGP